MENEKKPMSGAVKYLQKAAIGAMLVSVSASFAFTPLTGTLEASAVSNSSYSAMTKSLSDSPYDDVQPDHPAFSSIAYVAANNLLNDGGFGDFRPTSYALTSDALIALTNIYSIGTDEDPRLELARYGVPYMYGEDSYGNSDIISPRVFIKMAAYLSTGKVYSNTDAAINVLNDAGILNVEVSDGESLSDAFFTTDNYNRAQFATIIARMAKAEPYTDSSVDEIYEKNKNKTAKQLSTSNSNTTEKASSSNSRPSDANYYYDRDAKMDIVRPASTNPKKFTAAEREWDETRIDAEIKIYKARVKTLKNVSPRGVHLTYDKSKNLISEYHRYYSSKDKKYYLLFHHKYYSTNSSHMMASTTKSFIFDSKMNSVSINKVSSKVKKLLNTIEAQGYRYAYDAIDKRLFIITQTTYSNYLALTDSKTSVAVILENESAPQLTMAYALSDSHKKKVLKTLVKAKIIPNKSTAYYLNNFNKALKNRKAITSNGYRFTADYNTISMTKN